MSTKIYDAYKLNLGENPSYADVCGCMDKIRGIAHRTATEQFINQMIRTVVTAFDIKKVAGDQKLEEIVQKAKECYENNFVVEKRYWYNRAKFYESVIKSNGFKDNNCISLLSLIDMVQASWENTSRLNSMKASIIAFPHKDDVLAMLFGNRAVLQALDESDHLSDYHYQNQTDKPDEVSDEEWEVREKAWDDVLGPDFIPVRHGMKVDLVDTDRIEEDLLFGKGLLKFIQDGRLELPNKKYRASRLAEYLDCPIKKTDDISYSDFTKQYSEWKDSLMLEEKLDDISVDDFKAWICR